MAYNIRDILSSLGHETDDTAVQARLQGWEDEVMSALRAAGHGDNAAIRYGGNLPLNLLGASEQARLMGDYRNIIGFDALLNYMGTKDGGTVGDILEGRGIKGSYNKSISNIWRYLDGADSLGEDNPFGRFRGRADNSLISKIYSGISIQMADTPRARKAGRWSDFGPEHHFGVGSIPRVSSLSRSQRNVGDLAGKRTMIFDIETAGFRSGSIREIAYQTGVYGDPSSMRRGQVLMRPGQGTRGRMVTGRRAMPVDQFISNQFGMDISGIPAGSMGNDYLDRVMPWIDEARNVDRIVGHNIEDFDIGQIFEGVAGTKKYRTDPAFRKYIDESHQMIRDKTIDTLRLARDSSNLVGLERNPLLRDGGPFSISNLLLETDLAKRIGIENIGSAMGYDPSSGAFLKGLHFGDVDTLVTSGILEHLPDLQKVKLLDSGLTDTERIIAEGIQEQIRISAAITPFTKIRDPSNIHRRIKTMLGDVHPEINPIEQEVLLQRQLKYGRPTALGGVADPGIPSRSLLGGLGGFERMLGMGRGDSLMDMYNTGRAPSSRTFNRYRRTLKDRGFGFAGLSYEERLFGTALSDITAGIGPDKPFARLARETQVARFGTFDPRAMEYLTQSGKVTLPPQMLNAMGLLSETDNPAMFSMSIVNPTRSSPSASVNLAYRFSDQTDLDMAAGFLEETNRGGLTRFAEVMGLDPDAASTKAAFNQFTAAMDKGKLVEGLRTSGLQHGVSVAQVTSEDGAGDLIELMRRANNSDMLRDENMLAFRLPFMNAEYDETGQGVLRTAGAVLDLGIGAQERSAISDQVRLAERIYRPAGEAGATRGFSGIRQSARMANFADTMSGVRSGDAAERVTKIFNAFDNVIMPNAGKGIAGLAAVGIGALLLRRKRESDKYDVAMDYAGPEAGPSRYALADVLEQRQMSGYNGYYRQVDPLATASLTENLYYGRQGHSSTAWDRNTAIYGGVL